jgi:hypothetical protein
MCDNTIATDSNVSVTSTSPNFIQQLISGPQGDTRADEMAILALCIGGCFVLTLVVVLIMEVYLVLFKNFVWDPVTFSEAMVGLFGTTGAVLSALAYSMGKKAQFGG